MIAEEVAEVYPDALVYKDGLPDAVQFQKINALLLNDMQKQHDEIEKLERERERERERDRGNSRS